MKPPSPPPSDSCVSSQQSCVAHHNEPLSVVTDGAQTATDVGEGVWLFDALDRVIVGAQSAIDVEKRRLAVSKENVLSFFLRNR